MSETEDRMKETALQRLYREVMFGDCRSVDDVLAKIGRAVEQEQRTKETFEGLRITMMRNEIKAWERAHPPVVADGTVGMRRGE